MIYTSVVVKIIAMAVKTVVEARLENEIVFISSGNGTDGIA